MKKIIFPLLLSLAMTTCNKAGKEVPETTASKATKSTGDSELDESIADYRQTTKKFYESNKKNSCEQIKKNVNIFHFEIENRARMVIEGAAKLGYTDAQKDSLIVVNNYLDRDSVFAECAGWSKANSLFKKLKVKE